jgi:hypothetical protein
VDDDCLACTRSRLVASEVRRAYPDLEVILLPPDDDGAQHGHLLAAVPTYILDGRVVSLGNPRFEDLDAAIQARAHEVP